MLSMVIRFQDDTDVKSFHEFMCRESAWKDEVCEIIILNDARVWEQVCCTSQNSQLCLAVRARGKTQLIELEKIYYFEKTRRSISVHMEDGNCCTFYGKFEELMASLTEGFYQCHKSYVVNLEKVREMSRYKFTLENGETLPISQKKYRCVKDYLTRYIQKRDKSD